MSDKLEDIRSSLRHILQPIKLGKAEIRNRVVRTAHGTKLALYSFEDLAAFQAARARGGVGLTILEILAAHPSSPTSLRVWEPSHADGYRRMMDILRPLGMTVFQQIWHGGHHILPEDGSPPWSASDVASPYSHAVPIPMTKTMIDDMVESFASAARKCEEWGVQGVEIHCAHGYLPQQFLSPNSNRREDDYGGSFENRIRFVLELAEATRNAVSPGYPVGVRLGPDDARGGFGIEDNIRLANILEERKLVDFIDVTVGSYQSFDRIVAGMFEQAGYELPYTAPVSRQIRLPTIVTGRFRTLEEANQVIRQGDADMVALTRAHIADPDLVRKTLEGRLEEVRPCIGCNQACVAGIRAVPPRVACTVNPVAGFELSLGEDRLAVPSRRKRVLVVGGGPAGMEAARIAALRGHDVTLAEATSRLGGTVNLAAKVNARHGIKDITVWQEAEIYRLGVRVRLSTYLDHDDIVAEGADSVILATGSQPRMDGIQSLHPGEPIQGINLPHVISANELLEDRIPGSEGEVAVVVDDTGHYEGIAVCEYLLGHGRKVEFVTRHNGFAPLVQVTEVNEAALRRLTCDRFRMHLRSRVLGITREEVAIAPNYFPGDTNQTMTIAADLVVLITPNRGDRALFEQLQRDEQDVRIVGDANAPRYLPTAIREGWLAGSEV